MKSVGGHFEIKLRSTLELKQKHNPYFHNFNNPTHNTTLLSLTAFQGFFIVTLHGIKQ